MKKLGVSVVILLGVFLLGVFPLALTFETTRSGAGVWPEGGGFLSRR